MKYFRQNWRQVRWVRVPYHKTAIYGTKDGVAKFEKTMLYIEFTMFCNIERTIVLETRGSLVTGGPHHINGPQILYLFVNPSIPFAFTC